MKELIKIDLEGVSTLEEVQKTITKILEDGGSMKPFMFEINKKIQEIMLGQFSEKGTFFGVPFVTVERIDKEKVKSRLLYLRTRCSLGSYLWHEVDSLMKELGLNSDNTDSKNKEVKDGN